MRLFQSNGQFHHNDASLQQFMEFDKKEEKQKQN